MSRRGLLGDSTLSLLLLFSDKEWGVRSWWLDNRKYYQALELRVLDLNSSADVSLMVAFESSPRIGASFNTKLGAPGTGEVACRYNGEWNGHHPGSQGGSVHNYAGEMGNRQTWNTASDGSNPHILFASVAFRCPQSFALRISPAFVLVLGGRVGLTQAVLLWHMNPGLSSASLSHLVSHIQYLPATPD